MKTYSFISKINDVKKTSPLQLLSSSSSALLTFLQSDGVPIIVFLIPSFYKMNISQHFHSEINRRASPSVIPLQAKYNIATVTVSKIGATKDPSTFEPDPLQMTCDRR